MNRDKVILTGFAVVFSALILFGLLYDFNFYTFTDGSLRPITLITFGMEEFDGAKKALPIAGGIFCILSLIFLIFAAVMWIMRIFMNAAKWTQVAAVWAFDSSLIFAIITALASVICPLVLHNIDPSETFEYVEIGRFVVCAIYAGISLLLIIIMKFVFEDKAK